MWWCWWWCGGVRDVAERDADECGCGGVTCVVPLQVTVCEPHLLERSVEVEGRAGAAAALAGGNGRKGSPAALQLQRRLANRGKSTSFCFPSSCPPLVSLC